MKGYKVVLCQRADDDARFREITHSFAGTDRLDVLDSPHVSLVSVWIEIPRVVVRYRVGVPVRPNEGCGPLCAFKTKAQALEYARQIGHNRPWAVFPCEYTPSEHCRMWFTSPTFGKIDLFGTMDFPEGTVFADEVTLLLNEEVA